MASQRPWFRLSSIRAAAPPPAPAPPPVPAPPVRPPVIVRPAIPFRPPPPPPAPPVEVPPRSPAVTPTPPSPPPPPRTPTPPSSPVTKSGPRSPAPPSSPVTTPPPRSPPPPSSPVTKAGPPPPPRTPTPASSPVTKAGPRSPPPPSSPVTKVALTNLKEASPSVSTSPPASSKPTSPLLNAKAPQASPKIVKPSPAQMKPLSSSSTNPPSPLSLPPPQMKVLVHESIDKPVNTHNHVKKQVAGKDKKASDSEESGMRIIRIAGENRGAVMEVSSARNKNQGHILNKSGEEGQSNNTITTLLLNSNVQGINNSILFNTKCHHNDPGIHLSHQATPRTH